MSKEDKEQNKIDKQKTITKSEPVNRRLLTGVSESEHRRAEQERREREACRDMEKPDSEESEEQSEKSDDKA